MRLEPFLFPVETDAVLAGGRLEMPDAGFQQLRRQEVVDDDVRERLGGVVGRGEFRTALVDGGRRNEAKFGVGFSKKGHSSGSTQQSRDNGPNSLALDRKRSTPDVRLEPNPAGRKASEGAPRTQCRLPVTGVLLKAG